MTQWPLAQLFVGMAGAMGQEREGTTSSALDSPLDALAAAREGTLYVEYRLPISDADTDLRVFVDRDDFAAQCGRMESFFPGGDHVSHWDQVARWATTLDEECAGTLSQTPDHYWLEFDGAARAHAPNVFLCRSETRPPVDSADPFREAIVRFESLVSGGRLATPIYDATVNTVGGAGFVSYMGFMLGRDKPSVRTCVGGITLLDSEAVVETFDAGLAARLREVTRSLPVENDVMRTLLHMDWIDGSLASVGVEVAALRFWPEHNQSVVFRELAARLTPFDRQWIAGATRGRGSYSFLLDEWLTISRVLNHLKLTVDTRTAAVSLKAYVRYDWRSARHAVLSSGRGMPLI